MNIERRFYKRESVDLNSCFIVFANAPGMREFTGTIADISEGGIGIRLNDSEYRYITDAITPGTHLTFQSMDEYNLFNEVHTDVFGGEVEVVRTVDETENRFLGCKLVKQTSEYVDYLQNKKLSLFADSGYRFM